uniref:Major facilitator superfamily (MFS) profile domain-containing protein n=1 Tax=Bionectria ochroleuca TaxID=29856 RepID=A0A0B7K7N8_BIOOC
MMPTSSTAIVGDQPSKAQGTSDESVAVEKVEAGDKGQPQQETEQQLEYPSGPRFWVIVFALCLVGFLISLDSTVIATAVPEISNEFDSLSDIGWYSSVYFLTMCLPQLSFMKVYSRYPIRLTYGAVMVVFLAGSALCGAAPNSQALIAGRALAGLGAAGLYSGNNALVPFLAPAPKRPFFFGLFLGAMGLGLGSGPLIGGVLTENFYLNLPVGAFICLVLYFSVQIPARTGSAAVPIPWQRFVQSLDLPGLIILTPAMVCLLLALQWGGVAFPWSNGRVIALLVVFGVLMMVFIAAEVYQGDNAMLPNRIMHQFHVLSSVWFCICSNGTTAVLSYYLPIWFQGVKGDSPIQSGIHTLPLVITTGAASILGGGLMSAFGRVGLWTVIGSVSAVVGAGLFTSLRPNTSLANLAGYQILSAVGSAAGRLCPSVALQNILNDNDISYGFTLLTFFAATSVSIGQALFTNSLAKELRELGIPEPDIDAALGGGVNTVAAGLPTEFQAAVLTAMNESVVNVWRLPLVLSCLGMIGAVFIQRWSIREIQVPRGTRN